MTLPDDAQAVTVVVRGTTYDVCRSFSSLSAAMAGVAALGAIPERGYVAAHAPPLTPAAEALIERSQSDDPNVGSLTAGQAHEHDRAAYVAATNRPTDEE